MKLRLNKIAMNFSCIPIIWEAKTFLAKKHKMKTNPIEIVAVMKPAIKTRVYFNVDVCKKIGMAL